MKNPIRLTRWPAVGLLVFSFATIALAGASGDRPESEVAPSSRNAADQSNQPGFFRLLGSDFKNVFKRKENLLIIGAGLGAAWAASPLDQDIASSGFNSERNGGTGLDGFFEAGEIVGGAAVQLGGAFAAYGIGKLGDHPGLEELGSDLVRAQLVTQSFTFAIKTATRRERPDMDNRRSFPSGHVSGTFATAAVLERHYGWKAGIPAYAVASYIAGSRLNEGRHYLSDVIFGAALGIMVGRTVAMKVGQRRLLIRPAAVSDGVGVQVSLAP